MHSEQEKCGAAGGMGGRECGDGPDAALGDVDAKVLPDAGAGADAEVEGSGAEWMGGQSENMDGETLRRRGCKADAWGMNGRGSDNLAAIWKIRERDLRDTAFEMTTSRPTLAIAIGNGLGDWGGRQ